MCVQPSYFEVAVFVSISSLRSLVMVCMNTFVPSRFVASTIEKLSRQHGYKPVFVKEWCDYYIYSFGGIQYVIAFGGGIRN